MDSAQPHPNGKCIEKALSEQLLPPDSPDTSEMFGEPLVFPRVGDAYQVEILPIISEPERLQIFKNPADTEDTLDVSHAFLMGLDIPVVWTKNEMNKSERNGLNTNSDDSVTEKESQRFENCRKSRVVSNKMALRGRVELSDVGLENQEEFEVPRLVPGLSRDTWSDIEVESFLVSLYFFENNVFLMKRFIESKKIGAILSFYYGKFYKSDGHRRWSAWRKMGKRKNTTGSRFFSGWRQQELLNRLSPFVSDERKNFLVEATKKFSDGKLSLEEYVSTLKSTAGIDNLIKVMGIGKGKEDLTLLPDPAKNNQSARPKIPVGKACSSLSSQEIIKFLTGDFRLSKARANDLFWEAIWPRLLARGWHSEQPKSWVFSGSRNNLVFLVPGIAKFSRRKLVKGSHYFDSVSDVLNKVSVEPKILELEGEEIGRDSEAMLDPDNDRSDHQRQRYLKPRVSTSNPNVMEFTIVDTSLARGEKPFSVIELRNLPVETKSGSILSNHSKETEVDTEDSVDTSVDVWKNTHSSKHAKDMCDTRGSNQRMEINGSESDKKLMKNCRDEENNTSSHKHSRKEKSGRSDFLAPLIKRRRLTACTKAEASRSTENFTVESNRTVNSSNDFSAKECAEEKNPGIPRGNSYGTTTSTYKVAKPHTRPLFDLNLPQITSDPEDNECSMMEVDHNRRENPNASDSSFPSDTNKVVDDSNGSRTSISANAVQKQPTMQPTRQSTRNRPLTTRALEAFASGFMTSNRKRKGAESRSRENPSSRPSRKARSRGNVGTVWSNEDNVVNGDSRSETNTLSESLVENERRAAQELLGISKAAYPMEASSFRYD